MDGFSEVDLGDFQNRITMNELLRKKLGGPPISVQITSDLINGKIATAGRVGADIRDIFFLRQDALFDNHEKLAAYKPIHA